MLVQCPECNTKYNLSAEQVGPGGRKVRCTRCKHVFVAAPPQSTTEPDLVAAPQATPRSSTPAPQPDPALSFEDELESLFQERLSESTPRQEHTRPESRSLSARSNVDEDMVADLQGAFQQPLLEGPTKRNFEADESVPHKKKVTGF